MKRAAAICLACSTTLFALQHANLMKTFTSPDGMFEFKYSDILVHCRESRQQVGLWLPDNGCGAYIPVCDDSQSHSTRTLICLAFPKDRFKDSPTFEAATFSVAEGTKATSEKMCLKGSQDWVVDPRKRVTMETINGVKFRVFKIDGAIYEPCTCR
jgi:hypothetical protein